MATTKLAAGQHIETVTPKELKDALDTATRDWFNQTARGDAYPRIHAQGTIAAGAVAIGGDDAADVNLGPRDGFVWAVQRIAIFGLASGDSLRLFLNDASPATMVHPAITGYQSFGQYDLVMKPGDQLILTGAALTATGVLTVTGQAREVPMPLMWRLGG